MNDFQLLIDLHKRAKRQGPGGDSETRKSIALAMLGASEPLKIADIGCGTGASTMLLAHDLNAQVTAVDFLSDFIDVLKIRAESEYPEIDTASAKISILEKVGVVSGS